MVKQIMLSSMHVLFIKLQYLSIVFDLLQQVMEISHKLTLYETYFFVNYRKIIYVNTQKISRTSTHTAYLGFCHHITGQKHGFPFISCLEMLMKFMNQRYNFLKSKGRPKMLPNSTWHL